MNIVAFILFALQWVCFYGTYAAYCAAWHYSPPFFLFVFTMPFEYGFAFFLGQLFPTVLGIICLIIHSKLKKKKYVTYYCETCKDVVGAYKGKQCLCMTCRKSRRELPLRFLDWDNLTEEQQQEYIRGQ